MIRSGPLASGQLDGYTPFCTETSQLGWGAEPIKEKSCPVLPDLTEATTQAIR
jgi:hypothetical protein